MSEITADFYVRMPGSHCGETKEIPLASLERAEDNASIAWFMESVRNIEKEQTGNRL